MAMARKPRSKNASQTTRPSRKPRSKNAQTAQTQPSPDGPSELDPFAGLVGTYNGGLEEKSAFDAFLDQLEAEKPADFQETRPPEAHDWQIVRQAVYSEDNVIWTCSKCCRTISVERTETLGEALKSIGVMEDCAMQVASDVMSE